MASNEVLAQILSQLEALQVSQAQLQSKLDSITSPISSPSSRVATPPRKTAGLPIPTRTDSPSALIPNASSYGLSQGLSTSPPVPSVLSHNAVIGPNVAPADKPALTPTTSSKEREKALYPQRVIITTYPDQSGIKPVPITWGAANPADRGPVLCSRQNNSIKARNAIGAHSGSYSIYRALAIAIGTLDPHHKPNYSLTEPPVEIPFVPAWADPKKIVSFDPWGHLTPQVFKEQADAGLDVRPSIAITKAHIKMSELDGAAASGALKIDGKVVLESVPLKDEHGEPMKGLPGVELVTSKAAVEPVWYLPGVAERFGISEGLLRRALFEDTGGMYPELITRPDIKVFLPPIGGLTAYIFGNPAYLRDETKELTLRVHDECNGSDVFGSDICTCKPYLVFAIEEAVRCAQRGGVGLVVYFRKEGRALGEVTKYLVYNLRKRGGDSADKYFKSTEMIAGVKDMRFQALMPDILHWLGVKKIDNMVSMSDMKYNAIVESGIPILRRYDIPDHLIPPDSRVEIDAKIAAGYFTSGKKVTEEDLIKTVGRTWEETEH
ncbi:Uracil-regulated protein 1 [Tulasnella sp. 424]|nr:Uracil-regulated protein 1 [Tulasnella sp. 424]KAG8973413.1 Uracil-regulated protein 1 [Tulasnella sp. 425]